MKFTVILLAVLVLGRGVKTPDTSRLRSRGKEDLKNFLHEGKSTVKRTGFPLGYPFRLI